MKPIAVMKFSGGRGTDSQSVTTGASGVNPDRLRGFSNGALALAFGSDVDGTSNLYSGAVIQGLFYDEGGGVGQYVFGVAGVVPNNGWNQLVIDGTLTLTRASATFTTGGGNSKWLWATAHTIVTQQFGAAASVHTCVFS